MDDYNLQHGKHEIGVTNGTEADLYTCYTKCTKNPTHNGFIPIEKLSVTHLPEGFHDSELFDAIKCLADVTVREGVEYVSQHRPEFWTDCVEPYPLCELRGQCDLSSGSGRVYIANRYNRGIDKYDRVHERQFTTCPCTKCQHSDSPSDEWWEMEVETAAHVVFDESEASKTSIRLFFDSKNSPQVILDQISVKKADIKSDHCHLKCVTCAAEIGNKLDTMLINFKDLWEKVWNRYRSSRDEDRLTFIVSHPHGCPKQVNVGKWLHKEVVGNRHFNKFTYTASTCPGSSGAYVFILGYTGLWGVDQPVHSGTDIHGLNVSGPGHFL